MTFLRPIAIASIACVLAGCGGNEASQPTETSILAVSIASCVGPGATLHTARGKSDQFQCDGSATAGPREKAAVAEIKRYLQRHPPRANVTSIGCRRKSDAVTCAITLSHGCQILAVKGPSSNPWVVPGSGTCSRAK